MTNAMTVRPVKRKVHIEVLRIVAMLMIISLHYMGKGGALPEFVLGRFHANAYFARFVEALSCVSVNLYILISGYFLVDSRFKFEKVLKLWLQVIFYSAGIYLLFLLMGWIPTEYDNFYYLSIFLQPIGMKHNWYSSIYLILYCLFPFLAVMVKKLTKRQMQALIIILLLVFSKISTIVFPMSPGFEDDGYGIIWMVCLFVIAAYIKLYVPLTGTWVKNMVVYFVATILTFLSFFAISMIYLQFGKLDDFITLFFAYNSPTTIVASIAMFLAFLNMGTKEKTKTKKSLVWERIVLYIGGLTFGVYLIHEHILLRGLWVTLWHVPEAFEQWYFIFHYILVTILVFVICALIEAVRQWIFSILYRSRIWKWIQRISVSLDLRMNGEDLSDNASYK